MTSQSTSHAAPWTFWRVVWATLVLVAVGLSFWLLYRFHQALFILFIAIIMGAVLRPPVSWLQRRGIPGVAGVMLVYLLLLALLIGFALLLAPVIVEQTTTIAAATVAAGHTSTAAQRVLCRHTRRLKARSLQIYRPRRCS